jgi:hypothetical protein
VRLLDRRRLLLRKARVEKLARRIEEWAPAAASRLRDVRSDAGTYLFECAEWSDRASLLVENIAEVDASIERQGFWQREYEWRIGTPGSERIEESPGGYLVTTTCHGIFTAAVDSIQVAVEAKQVLAAIQKDLFYAIGWSSNEAGPRRSGREAYLVRLSTESNRRFRPRLSEINAEVDERAAWQEDCTRIRRGTWPDWDHTEKPVYEVTVENGRLSMSCQAPTLDRAAEFAGIYQFLEADISRLLEWWS